MKKYFIMILGLLLIYFCIPSKIEEEFRGVFISYIEISEYLKDKEEWVSKTNIKTMIQNVEDMKLNTIILQVKPTIDGIYPSSAFLYSTYLTDSNSYPYDVLDYFLQEAHKKNIKVYAWMNPYRIRTTGTREDIPVDSIVYPDRNSGLVYEKNGVFLNPAHKRANLLIMDGVRELLKYPIDGLLFDDYFYPGDDADLAEWEEYSSNHSISQEEYHLMVVSNMVKMVHEECKKKGVPFGISSDGNIENNYEKHFADVKEWLGKAGYIDFIMPQLYYGFSNSTKPFIPTLNDWNEIIQRDVPLYVALAVYKSNLLDKYAHEGEREWILNHDILKREIEYSRKLSHYKGFVLYRYDNVFTKDDSREEMNNIQKLLNN